MPVRGRPTHPPLRRQQPQKSFVTSRGDRDDVTVGQDHGGVLGSAIDALSWEDALTRITLWPVRAESRYVCACNAHSLVTADIDPSFRDVITTPTWRSRTACLSHGRWAGSAFRNRSGSAGRT